MIDAFGERATFYRARPLLFQARSRHVEVVSNSRNINLERWGLRLSRALSICHSVWGQHLEGLVKARSALKCREAETSTYFLPASQVSHRPQRRAERVTAAAAPPGQRCRRRFRTFDACQSVSPSVPPSAVRLSVRRSVGPSASSAAKKEFRFPWAARRQRRRNFRGNSSEEP